MGPPVPELGVIVTDVEDDEDAEDKEDELTQLLILSRLNPLIHWTHTLVKAFDLKQLKGKT